MEDIWARGGANQERYVCDYLMVLVNCMIYSSTQVMDIGLLITDLVSEYVSNYRVFQKLSTIKLV